MKIRGVVGKKIVSVDQEITEIRDVGTKRMVVFAIVLDDGTRLEPYTVETDFGDYAHDFRIVRPEKGRK